MIATPTARQELTSRRRPPTDATATRTIPVAEQDNARRKEAADLCKWFVKMIGRAGMPKVTQRELYAVAQRIAGLTRPPCHSAGFASVRWRDKLYWFSESQRPVIERLWVAAMSGAPFVSKRDLVRAARNAQSNRRNRIPSLFGLFAGSDAWGELVVPGELMGGPPGTYALSMPPEEV